MSKYKQSIHMMNFKHLKLELKTHSPETYILLTEQWLGKLEQQYNSDEGSSRSFLFYQVYIYNLARHQHT